MLTYNEAFNLITEAYIKDEIKPYNGNFCFCGTLANNNALNWLMGNIFLNYNGFSGNDFQRMEFALLDTIRRKLNPEGDLYAMYMYGRMRDAILNDIKYEDVLFEGMCNALEVMKQIYIEKGLPTETETKFTKRQLKTEKLC